MFNINIEILQEIERARLKLTEAEENITSIFRKFKNTTNESLKEDLKKQIAMNLKKKRLYANVSESLIKKLQNYENKETWEQYEKALKEFVKIFNKNKLLG